MADIKPPQDHPTGDDDPATPASEPLNGGAQDPAQASPQAAAETELTPAPDEAAPLNGASAGPGRVKRLVAGRRGAAAAVAVLCIAGGTVASLLGAHAVARSDATEARQTFPRTAAGIAATLKLQLQHDEDLGISGSTFFAGQPTASAAQFDTWVKWARALRRFPELQRLGFVALVRAPDIAAFQARISGHPLVAVATPVTPARLGSTPIKALTRRSVPTIPLSPAGARPYYCLTAVELSRNPRARSRAGLDYCAHRPALLHSRDTGLSLYTAVSLAGSKALSIQTPVYRGNVPPSGFAARRAAFVGWLREVLVPGAVLAQALRGHPGYALHVRYKSGSSNVVFSSGAPAPLAQSSTVSLHNGWTVRSFGAAPGDAGVLANGTALALLIGGILLSVLLGLLVFLLGRGRGQAPAPRAVADAPPSEPAGEELYDSLTGLPNRALMLDRADRMLARATRQSGLLVGALFIDIDWFKDVNDKLGAAAGDQLLEIVAERLDNVVRAHDTVGRLGGDEFVVLVESAARGARLDSLARRVIEALHKPVELDGFGPSFSLTASIGVAFGRYAAPEDLLRDAQLALVAAKTAGRDRYTLFNANMRSVIEGRGVLEVELNTAVADGQFFLLYQPIYDLLTRRVVGLEALVRWNHPTKGVLPPEEFLPLAEDTGLIVPIGRWALEQATSHAAAWHVAGHPVSISVKVSTYQLNREGLVTDVRRALQQSGIDPALLTLEIEETAVMRDVAAAAARLSEIKQLGVCIAIDDFGSGYAHHSDLRRLPLDFLKVDRSSLAASEDEEYRSWLLQAVLIVGRDLSLPVIATGVDSHEQLAALQTMGCPMAQGVFMGAPAPAEAVNTIFDGGFPTTDSASSSLFD
jgi:diguanylate cyclase (GGDEF)-like protein